MSKDKKNVASDLRSLTGRQCRTARAWLDWTREDLARESGASVSSIVRLEDGSVEPRPGTAALILAAFRRHRITFGAGRLQIPP